MNAVGAGSGEGLHSPLDGVLHGRRAGDAAADLVRQTTEIVFQRRGLKRDLDDLVGVIGVGGSCSEPGKS